MPDLDAVLPIDAFGVVDTPAWWAVAALALVWVVELAVFSWWLRGQLDVRRVPGSSRGLPRRHVPDAHRGDRDPAAGGPAGPGATTGFSQRERRTGGQPPRRRRVDMIGASCPDRVVSRKPSRLPADGVARASGAGEPN
jgi:hypothetical protein